MALSRAAIVDAGLAILDEYGLGDLSMRRVADSLGVQAGALYYHVPNKQSLLAAIADQILATLTSVDDLSGWAHSLRAALLTHRDAAELVSSSHALGLGTLDPTAGGRDLLARAGHPEPEATMAALLHFVLGHVVEEQTRTQMYALGVLTEFDPALAEHHFRVGVDTFVRGVTPVG
ncbi:TetR family transcriptional regulator [Tessaracoccus sp. MC1865]|uniref:TetR family transcriptional regulator n=1 Tax=unclassified Tessaracoccus TaxID=2635419 RepID=UPI001600F4A8|nr:TetR/AcrR family transcriptional regulator C-terminal domain-containing protein [Tessaracoccus sp. MC1865]MBB1484283.1 TetR family transcriptional regulator [Tessaracoccus sp. MC1865]MBB1510777.1 TetR family transcriptional regulator [Tessaracoccus sp. MC1756]QTO38598.1 TetR family transcriptional regulator [Tessaracoccus sp. MC1865]